MVRKTASLLLPLLMLLPMAHDAYTKDRSVAIILASSQSKYKAALETFQSAVKASGKEGQFQFVVSTPSPDPTSWKNAIARAEGHDTDVIVAIGAPIAYAAVKEKVSAPVLYADVFDKGLVEKPGTKIAGVYNNIPVVPVVKYLQQMNAAKTINVLYSPYETESEAQANKIKAAAAQEKIPCELHPVKTAAAATQLSFDAGESLVITCSSMIETNAKRIIDAAAAKGIPSAGFSEAVANDGAVISLAPDPREEGTALAKLFVEYASSGAVPKSVQLSKINFIVNLAAAKRASVNVPLAVINNATKVIK